MEDYVERETAVAKKCVEDAETVIMQEQEEMTSAENVELTIRDREKMSQEMVSGIGDSLSDLASFDDGKDGQDEDGQAMELGTLSDDDEPGWVVSTIPTVVQQHEERFRQKQLKLYEPTQLGWGDAANYIHERDMKEGPTELDILAVVKLQTVEVAAAPALTISFEELMESLVIVPGMSEMRQGTAQPGCTHTGLCSGKPPSN